MMTTPTTTTDVTTGRFEVNLRAVTSLEAPCELAWAVLTDTAAYPDWNPFLRRFDGELRVGSRLSVDLEIPGRKVRTMRPHVTEVHDGVAFEWLGRVGLPRVFDGRHRFELRSEGADRCELVHSERLSGLLVPMFRSMLTGPTAEGFAAFNDAFAAEVRRRAT